MKVRLTLVIGICSRGWVWDSAAFVIWLVQFCWDGPFARVRGRSGCSGRPSGTSCFLFPRTQRSSAGL